MPHSNPEPYPNRLGTILSVRHPAFAGVAADLGTSQWVLPYARWRAARTHNSQTIHKIDPFIVEVC